MCVCVRVCVCVCLVTQLCPTICNPMDCDLPGSSIHGISPGKNTGVSCHFVLQGIFPTQGLNLCLLCLLHWQTDSLPGCHLGVLFNKQLFWVPIFLYTSLGSVKCLFSYSSHIRNINPIWAIRRDLERQINLPQVRQLLANRSRIT